jgi:hypothetical protein
LLEESAAYLLPYARIIDGIAKVKGFKHDEGIARYPSFKIVWNQALRRDADHLQGLSNEGMITSRSQKGSIKTQLLKEVGSGEELIDPMKIVSRPLPAKVCADPRNLHRIFGVDGRLKWYRPQRDVRRVRGLESVFKKTCCLVVKGDTFGARYEHVVNLVELEGGCFSTANKLWAFAYLSTARVLC